ncbi:MAG TPA: hypothetical protein DCS97_02190 [Planctomycetes bacterium]|nr:hypothetical protein [Planctomycetota bacterium]
MLGKNILPTILFLLTMVDSRLGAEESTILPSGTARMILPVGWEQTADPGLCVLLGPGRTADERPRLTCTVGSGTPDEATEAMRSAYRRLTDGCEILDDDRIPVGGRIWNRLRVRFAVGPLAFAQTAWIGEAEGRTLVFVLSAPDDLLARHLQAATAAIASLSRAPR